MGKIEKKMQKAQGQQQLSVTPVRGLWSTVNLSGLLYDLLAKILFRVFENENATNVTK